MKIFLDSADINEIKTYIDTGFVDGVTANPSLTDKGLAAFISDWEGTGQSIL